jgi:MFS family permease
MTPPQEIAPSTPLWGLAFALALGAAVSLGITRFAYGLLLPPMRADLGWTYTLAGGMNTANALGYFMGALATPALMRRFGPSRLLWVGALLSSVFMAWSGFFVDAAPLLLQRLLAGIASALVFVAGGLLAARLGARDPKNAGLLLGVYYSGTGVGIVASALLVPWLLEVTADQLHGWRWSWWALAALCAAATAVLLWPARVMQAWAVPQAGYIVYMTFVVALLRAQGSSALVVTVFYGLLGLAVMASSRIWARLLDKYRGGQPMALLNGLLGVATLLPALTHNVVVVMLSGLMFGGVFLSVVASTTALVRHNLPPAAWAAGISAFTVAFAAGQTMGPTIVGWIADGAGGLARGLVFSAVALWLGALLAMKQKAL